MKYQQTVVTHTATTTTYSLPSLSYLQTNSPSDACKRAEKACLSLSITGAVGKCHEQQKNLLLWSYSGIHMDADKDKS